MKKKRAMYESGQSEPDFGHILETDPKNKWRYEKLMSAN